MIPSSIENSIIKYLNSEASISEMEQLESWLQDDHNHQIFKDYVKLNYLIDINTAAFDDRKVLEALAEEMKRDKVIRFRQKTKIALRYASIAVILISSALFFYYINSNHSFESDRTINEVVLKSENGNINVLSQSGQSQIKDRNGNIIFEKKNNNLVYASESSTQKLNYNTITVPYGRQFSLELSDGTKVQLNAGTSFRFPVQFIEEQNRQVFIEYGEAFFDVAKDTSHPFVVSKNNMDITVLGTQFNVSAYPEDDEITTVLVEGSVRLNQTNKNTNDVLLEPGFKALWSTQKDSFDISAADIEFHTGWRNGKIVLKSLEFSKMIKKLERHYDVVIDNNDDSLNQDIITATFDNESIEEVLELINKIHPMQYNIDGKNIQIFKN